MGHFLLLHQPWTVAHLGSSGHPTLEDTLGTDSGFWDGQTESGTRATQHHTGLSVEQGNEHP